MTNTQSKYPAENLAAWIKLADAFNELEKIGYDMQQPVEVAKSGMDALRHEFEGGDYSIEWDSIANRWVLISELDDAPELCAYNRTRTECTELDPCEDCWQLQVAMAKSEGGEHHGEG